MTATKAFKEAFLHADTLDADGGDFNDFGARKLRYDLLWAHYENTSYRHLHKWATAYKTTYGLYKYTRNIYNPSLRIGNFWRTHTWGGRLDAAAGDGESVPSALPILTEDEVLRPAIAQLWRWSNWAINKDIVTLWGSIFGDVGLQVIDDTVRQKVYLKLVHPGIIKSVTLDPFGNVKGYTFEEERADPRGSGRTVTYTETAERDGDSVVYATYLDNVPYAWNGETAEWSEPYGFVPLVMTQHNNVGLDWGWSELHAGLSKIREADDLASKLSDQIRIMVDAPWLIAGMKQPSTTPRVNTDMPPPTTAAGLQNPEAAREQMNILYASDPQAKATALVAPLDIAATLEAIREVLAELERDYPELQMDIWSVEGDPSGRALRVARQRVESKVHMRRGGYDDALARAQQMGVAIGGFRGLEGFGGFNLDSYAAGKLDHSVGERPVFTPDPMDDIELSREFWISAGHATKAGIPLPVFLRREGWSEADIRELEQSPEWQSRLAMQQAALDGLTGDEDA